MTTTDNVPIPLTPQIFADELASLIKRSLESGIAPRFLVMELTLMEHELANFHIKLKRDAMEQAMEKESSGIVGLNGQPAQQN